MRKFFQNEEGAAALEFGFVAIPLVALTMAIIEFALIFFVNASMESGVIQASRYAVTGHTTPGITREEKVLEILVQHGYGLIDIQPEDLTTLIYPNFASVGQPEPYVDANSNGMFDGGEDFTDVNGNGVWDDDMGLAGLGGPGDIVVYKIDYDWGLMTELLKPMIGDLTFISTVAVRNEPY